MKFEELIAMIKNIDETSDQVLDLEDAKLALRLSNLHVVDTQSALLFFAAMNFLNAYVKKPDADPHFHKRYMFKNDVARVLERLLQNPIDGVSVYLAPDVTYVSVGGLQFSFHNLDKTEILTSYQRSDKNIVQEWTGLRLQPAAKQVLDYALEEISPELKQRLKPVDPVLVFKALGDPIRFSIYQTLCKKESCACDILEKFSITQPTLSHHMGKLVQSGLIIGRKDGIWMRYSVDPMIQDQIEELFTPIGGKMGNEVKKPISHPVLL
jgi:ArsR family transcriptional regulator